VAKVDELMALVDQLEEQLTASRASAENLMEAVVAEIIDRESLFDGGDVSISCGEMNRA